MVIMKNLAHTLLIILLLTITTKLTIAQGCGGAVTYPLLAGQTITVGNVQVEQVHADSLKVTYLINHPWELTEYHMGYAYNITQFPTATNGNVKNGSLNFSGTLPMGTNTWSTTFFFRDDTATVDTVWFLTHAVVKNTSGVDETAWAGDKQWNSPKWTYYFGYCVDNTPLPVDLLYFTAEVTNFEVHFKWKTTMELNNEGFHIQGSNDGLEFTNIAFISGQGTTKTPEVYDYTIKHENVYYRLKQVDHDGTTEYSNIVHCGQPVQAELVGDKLLFNTPVVIMEINLNGSARQFHTIEYTLKNGINILVVDNRVLKIYRQ